MIHGTHGRMLLPSREADGLQWVQRADASWGSKAVLRDFQDMERLWLGVVFGAALAAGRREIGSTSITRLPVAEPAEKRVTGFV